VFSHSLVSAMILALRSRVRHPLYPDLAATPAVRSRGQCIALAGTFSELVEAATAGARPRRAVFVLTYANQPFLGDSQRDELWHTFQVPVFALLLDRNRRILGYECEVQHGLHLSASAPFAETHPGILKSSACDCGRPGQRLLPPSAKPLAMAVSAF